MSFEAGGPDDPSLTGGAPARVAPTTGWARPVCRLLNLLGVALCVWGLLVPRPYAGLILASVALPLLAALAVGLSGGRIAWSSSRTLPGPSVETALWGAAGILGVRTFLDIDVLDWGRLLPGALAAGLGGTLVVVGPRPWRRSSAGATGPTWLYRLGETLLVWLFISFYAYGVIAQANSRLDGAPAKPIAWTVIAKAARNDVASLYELAITDRDGHAGGSLSVRQAVYDAVPVGGQVCIREHPGALRVRWRTVSPCSGMG